MLWFLTLTLAAALPADEDDAVRYVLVTRTTQHVEATLTYRIQCPRMQAREWIGFVAQAPELPGQTKLSTTPDPKGTAIEEKSSLHRNVLRLRVPVNTREAATEFPIRVTYEAMLRSRVLRPRRLEEKATPGIELAEAERKASLVSLGDLNHADREFRNWLQTKNLMRGTAESRIDFARRVFQFIRSSYTYKYQEDQDRRASKICQTTWSDCGGLSVLFVSVLRASGIPARTLYGRWAQSARSEEKLNGSPYYQWHVKAEFFVQGVGWIPADLASSIEHDRSPTGLRFFGQDRGDFLAFHIDPDLELDTVRFSVRHVSNLQTPAYWVFGSGSAQQSTAQEDWKVRRLP